MRTVTTEHTLYDYSELSDTAQERVQEDYNRFLWESGDAHECMQIIADGILEDAGFGPAENLEYNLYMQGGYPTWTPQDGLSEDVAEGLSDRIFWAMRDWDEEMSNDENTAEWCEANEYEFHEDGRLA